MEKTYDIALSFSMVEKELVEKVYHYLKAEEYTVFFAPAPECQEVLSGRNQREVFYEIFGLKAEYVALFVSESYVKRAVTMEECEISILKHGGDGKVIPIYLDDTHLPENLLDPKQTNYFKPQLRSAIEIANHLAGRMANDKKQYIKKQIDEMQMSTMHVHNNTSEKQIFIQNVEGSISL